MKHKLIAARRSNNPWVNLRISNKTYNKLHTKTKRNEWRKFCADTESAKESARMSKILKNCNDKKAKLESVYKPDSTLTETPDETLEIMKKIHFKDGDPPTHTNIIQKAWHNILKTVRNIMIKSHEMQNVPGPWTESNCTFLPKRAKQITINLTPTAQ